MASERVGIFVDGPNLWSGAKQLVGTGHLDLPRLVTWMAQGRDLTEFAYWTAPLVQLVNPRAYAGQRRFFASLENNITNGRVELGIMQRRGGGRWVEKGVDVGVALDVVVGAFQNRWDTAIVVSGDGDIARAGTMARALGKRFEVVCCERTLSAALRAEADSVTILTASALKPFVH